MSTVQIDSQSYDAYADLGEAALYLAASSHAANWDAATDVAKSKALITATRILDRQNWLGDKTSEDQPLEWPRKGTGVTGVEDDMVPADIVHATIELALAIIDGSTVQSDQNTSQKISSISAGSVSISYFRGAEGAAFRFPLIVQELVSDYLAGYAAGLRGAATGVDTESSYDEFGLTGPL